MQPSRLITTVPAKVLALSLFYAAVLAWLERRFQAIRPDYIWMEVVGGVLISLVPAAIQARQNEQFAGLSWKTYESTVWMSFFASGAPIILWQLGETFIRRVQLMNYVLRSRR